MNDIPDRLQNHGTGKDSVGKIPSAQECLLQ